MCILIDVCMFVQVCICLWAAYALNNAWTFNAKLSLCHLLSLSHTHTHKYAHTHTNTHTHTHTHAHTHIHTHTYTHTQLHSLGDRRGGWGMGSMMHELTVALSEGADAQKSHNFSKVSSLIQFTVYNEQFSWLLRNFIQQPNSMMHKLTVALSEIGDSQKSHNFSKISSLFNSPYTTNNSADFWEISSNNPANNLDYWLLRKDSQKSTRCSTYSTAWLLSWLFQKICFRKGSNSRDLKDDALIDWGAFRRWNFSEVSLLYILLFTMTVELTFENFYE